MSVLVPKLPSTVKFIPDLCNMTCYPADVVISGVAMSVLVPKLPSTVKFIPDQSARMAPVLSLLAIKVSGLSDPLNAPANPCVGR
jgi:uncharacterized Fe-S cluster-containing protein